MSHKFTPEARAGIIARLEVGVPYKDAALAAGVRPETARSWLTRGRREESGAYAEFADAVEEARVRAASRPEPLGADELARLVSQAARNGSVQALKLRWAMLRAEREEEPGDDHNGLAALDDLVRRARR